MPPAGSFESKHLNGFPEETAYPSRTIAYQAAGMITSIIENLQLHDQLRFTPAFIVYSLFSALIMHVYQMRSSNQTIVSATQTRLTSCMNALRDVSKVWLVAKMVHTLFESILGNKVLEERLQKAAGRRHQKAKPNGVSGARTAKSTPPGERAHPVQPQGGNDNQKRKFDDMEFGYTSGPPAAQMSYERSRPQSPVLSPSHELPDQQQAHHHQQLPTISATSPPVRHSTDAFMGTSRANTRPTTPFNGFSYPGTPPDLFLHTRNSPKISEDLWQNYDPGQLFPPEANGMGMGLLSPNEGMVDPALRQAAQQVPNMSMHPDQQGGAGQHLQPAYHQDPQAWSQLQAGLHAQQQHQQAEDQWSTSSSTGPIVPTTLNVGDWFEFFGIPNGDQIPGGMAGLVGGPLAGLQQGGQGGGYG
ncbi:Transcriptional activator of fatty acid utilization [Recurvomyces mirabilis]|nr:Transcriptional activator of fatty acid utilization [Recurvomyces mirabilis]